MYRPHLQSVALTVPEIIVLQFWRGVVNPQSWGREAVGGRGCMVPFERALVTSCGLLSIVTFPLSLRVSEIFPVLFSSTPLFPTPPLVFLKFPHVPLRSCRSN